MNKAKPWVDGLTIDQVLQRTAARYAEQEAAVFAEIGWSLSWAQLEEEVRRAASGLWALGVRPGEHVAVWATNVPQWLIAQFATAHIGAVLVTINPAYRRKELEYVLRQSDAAALLLIDRFRSSDYFATLHQAVPELSGLPRDRVLRSDAFPRLRRVISMRGETPGAWTWEDMLELGASMEGAALERAAFQLQPLQAINIQYTSGTTGQPKAAMLSHRNLLLNAYYVGACQRLRQTDRICIPVPFYHCFGCVLGSLCASVYGAAMIIPTEHFDAEKTLDAVEQCRATALYGVPTMFIAQLQLPGLENRDLSSLRTGIMAGSPCPIEVMKQVIDRLGAREITIAYGQTEAAPVITQTRCDDPLDVRVETVGRALPGVEIKVIDAAGNPLGDEQQGELCCRGHGVMLGYYNNEEATQKTIDQDGWLHTGDLAVRLPNCYYRITGRMKDMVIRGGENIYPREIEEYLFQHPGIEQASVVGLPDVTYGEELCAWIRLKPGEHLDEAAVHEYCRQGLAHFKVPRYVRFVESFPQTVTGKIQKFKIRAIMIGELGLSAPETA